MSWVTPEQFAAEVVRTVCELPDYTSPDDRPNLLQCTVGELTACIIQTFEHFDRSAHEATVRMTKETIYSPGPAGFCLHCGRTRAVHVAVGTAFRCEAPTSKEAAQVRKAEMQQVETSRDDARDAARYRFLRQPGNAIVYAKDRNAWGKNASGHVQYDTAEQLDAAVDAARGAGGIEQRLSEKASAPHECVWQETTTGGAQCATCKIVAEGWYCPKSPNHLCKYSRSFDMCDHCGRPEERK